MINELKDIQKNTLAHFLIYGVHYTFVALFDDSNDRVVEGTKVEKDFLACEVSRRKPYLRQL